MFLFQLALLGALLAGPTPLFAHGDLHDQIVRTGEQIEMAPDSAPLYLIRGRLHALHGEPLLAEADLARALALDPGLREVHLARGELLLQTGRHREALDAVDRYLRSDPTGADALLVRARALAFLGRNAEAVLAYDTLIAVARRPLPEHFLHRAELLATFGPDRLAEAIAGLDEGIAHLGPAVTLQRRAMELEVEAGRCDQALGRLDRAGRSIGSPESVLAMRGRLLLAAGRTMEAGAVFSELLSAIHSLPPRQKERRSVSELEREAIEALNRVAVEVAGKRRGG